MQAIGKTTQSTCSYRTAHAPNGDIETPLDENEVREAAKLFAKRGLDAVIVGFLFSFLNDIHEKRAKEIVCEEMPNAFVCTSSEVVNVMREYERFSSTAMNAYIGPKTSLYLLKLEQRLRENGIDAVVRIMQSNGGISTLENTSQRPIGLLLSGRRVVLSEGVGQARTAK